MNSERKKRWPQAFLFFREQVLRDADSGRPVRETFQGAAMVFFSTTRQALFHTALVRGHRVWKCLKAYPPSDGAVIRRHASVRASALP